MTSEELRARYGTSKRGNFYVKDTIGVPHPYCITPKHVEVASDRHGGLLGESAIRDAEQRGARCGMRGCRLTWEEHEKALLVSCKVELKDSKGVVRPELHAYLLACKEKCEQDGYAGFAFIKEG